MTKETENIDRYLRESLGSFKPRPSDGAWSGVSRRLPLIGALHFLRFYRFGIATVILLTLLITGVWMYYDNPAEQIKQTAKPPVVNQQPAPVKELQSEPSPVQQQAVPEINEPVNIPAEKKEASLVQQPIKPGKKYQIPVVQEEKTPEPVVPQIVVPEEVSLTHTFPHSLRMILLERLPLDKTLPAPGRISYAFPHSTAGHGGGFNWFPETEKVLSLSFIPELAKQGNTFNPGYGVEFTGAVAAKDYILETGIGLHRSSDEGDYRVNYSQYDSTGFYYKVTSFTIDPVTGDPNFITAPEVVYDTIDYRSDLNTNNRFTYLKIPFNAGLRLGEYKRFTLWLKAGASWAVKTSSQVSEPGFSNSKALYYTIDNNSPTRITTYWQLNTGLGLWYAAGTKVGIHIEPMYQVYMVPVYERKYNVKSPFSLGLKAGVHIKL